MPRSEPRTSRCYSLERFNEPVEWPLRISEAIDQERPITCEPTSREFGAVGYGTSIIGVLGKDFLDGGILVRNVVAPKSCELDLDGPSPG